MESFFSMAFNLLISPPGNYLYYLVLAIFTATCLQSTYMTRRGQLEDSQIRVMIGMFSVLLIQILFLSSSFLGWAGFADPRQYLPPVDRAVTLLMVTILLWVWCFPEKSKFADITIIFDCALIVFFLIGNLLNQFSIPPELSFNASIWDWVWQILTMISAVIAIMILINRSPAYWQIGCGFFGLILFGYVINLAFLTNEGSFSGITRLAILAAFLLLPTIAQRFQAAELAEIAPIPEIMPERTGNRRDFKELETWLGLNSLRDVDNFLPALIRLVCQTMRADRAFIVVPSETQGQIIFQTGYDYETDESIPMSSGSDATMPGITRAVFFGKTQILDQKENHSELSQLAVTARIAGIGSALFVPFLPQQKKWGGLLLIKSSTRKSWNSEDEGRLTTLSRSASLVLEKIIELDNNSQSLKKMAADLDTSRLENQALKDNLKILNEQSGYGRAEPELNALLSVQQESQELIAALQRDNRQLQKEIEKLRITPEQNIQYPESDLNHLLDELTEAKIKISTLENSTRVQPQSIGQLRLIEAILQDLRRPMASITGYIELLLSDSSHQDEELQEKSLKSLHASLENLHSLLNDLDNIDVLKSGVIDLQPDETDLSDIIDQAVVRTRAQLSQKGLNLRIDLPDQLPTLFSYKDSIKQVMIHLIENAIGASSIGSDIGLKVQSVDEKENEIPYLLIQVTDSGGGIDMNDISRVFSRPPTATTLIDLDEIMSENSDKPGSYAEQTQPIKELGGTGGRLFIAKRLIEAHGGRIWVDSEKGETSTFSVLLPLRPQAVQPDLTEI